MRGLPEGNGISRASVQSRKGPNQRSLPEGHRAGEHPQISEARRSCPPGTGPQLPQAGFAALQAPRAAAGSDSFVIDRRTQEEGGGQSPDPPPLRAGTRGGGGRRHRSTSGSHLHSLSKHPSTRRGQGLLETPGSPREPEAGGHCGRTRHTVTAGTAVGGAAS